MPFFVYMVECANGQFYTGWSTDPTRRLKQHNRGKGARFTVWLRLEPQGL